MILFSLLFISLSFRAHKFGGRQTTSHRITNFHVVFREPTTRLLFRPTTFLLISRPCFRLRPLFLECDRVPSTDANVTLVIMSPAAIAPPPYDNCLAIRLACSSTRQSSLDTCNRSHPLSSVLDWSSVPFVGFPDKRIFQTRFLNFTLTRGSKKKPIWQTWPTPFGKLRRVHAFRLWVLRFFRFTSISPAVRYRDDTNGFHGPNRLVGCTKITERHFKNNNLLRNRTRWIRQLFKSPETNANADTGKCRVPNVITIRPIPDTRLKIYGTRRSFREKKHCSWLHGVIYYCHILWRCIPFVRPVSFGLWLYFLDMRLENN